MKKRSLNHHDSFTGEADESSSTSGEHSARTPLVSNSSGTSGGSAPPHQSSSGMPAVSVPPPSRLYLPPRVQTFLFRSGRTAWLRVGLAAAILLRFAWNILWLHSHWIPESITSLAQLPPYYYYNSERRSVAATTSEAASSGSNNSFVEDHNYGSSPTSWANRMDDIGTGRPIHYHPEWPPERIYVFRERRTVRRDRTRPRLSTARGGEREDDDFNSLLYTGEFESVQRQLDIAPEQDWPGLCRRASLSANSRVVISGILSQPPGQALAFLLNRHCNVTAITGADPLFPNLQRRRLKQMDDYRELKRGIEGMKLVVPSALPFRGSSGAAAVDPNKRKSKKKKTPTIDFDAEEEILHSEFRPTHVILIETLLPDLQTMVDESFASMYNTGYRLKIMKDALLAAVSSTSSNSGPAPVRFVHVLSPELSGHVTTLLQTVLLKTFQGVHQFPVVQLDVPYVYGPMGIEEKRLLLGSADNSTDDNQQLDLIYVDEAISAMLQSLQFNSGFHSFVAHPTFMEDAKRTDGVDSGEDDSIPLTDEDRNEIIEFRESETQAWLSRDQYEHLGNAIISAKYIDTFGVPRVRFPCSSKCESTQCIPSAFESIREISINATDGCEFVLYIADFRTSLDYLDMPKHDGDSDDEPTASISSICRVAFISGKSRLARGILLPDDKNQTEIPRDELLSQNGKLSANTWRVVWLPDDDDKTLSMSDRSLLRIDPAGMFAVSVTRALYTESPAYMKAPDAALNDTFAEMTRKRIGKRQKKVRRPGTSVYQRVTIPAQKSRKVIFFAKEPRKKEFPKSLKDFVKNADTFIPSRQVEFYEESSKVMFSDVMRPGNEISQSLYRSIPYLWFSTKFFVHDLTMKHSQEFRCSWFKEQLHWGGDYDAELLSFAYLVGHGRLADRFGDRDEEATSWIPLMDPEYPGHRLRNARGWELFLRIKSPY